MRIAIISPPWVAVPPPAYGGTENVLDILARALQSAGHDVLLYATGDSRCPVELRYSFDAALGVSVGGTVAELRQVVDAYHAVREWGAEVVHDHTLAGPLYANRFPELAVVTTNHGPFDGNLGKIYQEVATRVPVIAISHHQASTARGVPITAVIHHGVDLDRFPAGTGGGGYALFLGRMTAEKGVHVAAKVARAAGVPLRIAAKMREVPEREYFEEQVKPLLGGGVEYIGEVGAQEKMDLLAGATCLLNPIAWPEPFGMVMVEALACGTPVVTTPRGAAPEIVDDGVTGLVRAEESALVRALAEVQELDRSACRRAVKERFSASRLASEHVDVYRQVAATPRSR
ncbi:MAG: glycosyltransferase family 4 protein [Actinomycetota bacterium]|jgi:glycosyltransferase involved in cell wall biosynthesis|nr:glycosyltransferase family 4 protein [Actinomycetota bacterium]